MNKKLLLFTLLGVFCFACFAEQINEETARNVGKNFLISTAHASVDANIGELQLIYRAGTGNTKSLNTLDPTVYYYVFNTITDGFVIVSGDDAVDPILAYSNSGSFSAENIPQCVAKWLEDYKSEIRRIVNLKLHANAEISELWNRLKGSNDYNARLSNSTSINPLMLTQWNQSPYENTLCPGGSVTGCVATAMAQIMKYWNYPATGSGFHSYNHQTYGTLSANFGSSTYQWGSMPNVLTSVNTAVGALMYDVGVSVDMNYSPQVSGAWVIENSPAPQACSEYALKTYFGYKSTLNGVERVNYSDAQWLALLKSELDASRPILYAGFGSGGGHCFVADGYDVNDFVHFNWGWGGAYDGYFHINSLDPSGTGTGGGSGGYNSGHQAVVGIEPPTGTQTFSMALYDYVTPTASTIYYGQAFDVSTNISNSGTSTYNGDYTVAVFDDNYNFVDYVQTLTGYTLQGGFAYTNNLVFSTSGLFSMLPGTYYLGVYYRPTGGNWFQVANSGSYTNFVQLTVINPNEIELNSAMIVTPGTSLIQGQAVSVNLNIINDGLNTFFGQYGVGLYNLDGTLAQTVSTVDENAGLPTGYTYLAPYLTFTNSSVTVVPGTYLLAVQHNYNSTGWQLTGSSYFSNPIKVTVVAPNIQADIYEVNDAVNQSYNLPVSFVGNSTVVNTVGSNCHTTSDNDFYKIILPASYNYTITPRLHDSYNSGNGNTYTLDGLFSYSTDGVTWSDAFDDVIGGSVSINGGGTLYFHVAPYFAGETGTYLLDIPITRAAVIGIDENEIGKFFDIYPNPAINYLLVDFNEFAGKLKMINLLTISGQKVFSTEFSGTNNQVRLSLNNLSEGFYFLELQTSEGVATKKIVLSR